VKPVRVQVANHPRLMRELLIVMATIADQPDIELVGESWNESDMANIVEQVQPAPKTSAQRLLPDSPGNDY
jgi:chemotaxis response regulator CheB